MDAQARSVEGASGSREALAALRVIAIDGPAGAGKSTVARALAQQLALTYLDTGAMYRAVTLAALRRRIDPADVDAVAAVASAVTMDVGEQQVLLDGDDVTAAIRSPEVNLAVSAVAANPAVRLELRNQQRAWAAARGGGVIEGRDIGTVVFPDAPLKLYLTASPEVRAARRHQEQGDTQKLEDVAAAIATRDHLDRSRSHAPLAEAADAVVVDTSDRSVDAIVAEIVELLVQREAR
jgi:cytidylate kinase